MVVQHNLRAMNSNRMLSITQGTLNKSTEKLSSGYKVNRAADDAAGLSISEKMRNQI
ncbi:MAG: flagellar hook protein, partial [Lachnospiraceae bacterium]|nr:flagellar hook protein [Lachnospiraceae bacterium]